MEIVTKGIILAVVLAIAGLAGMFSERSGTVNISINGMMIGGAVIYWILSRQLNLEGVGMQIGAYLISFVSGMIIGLIFGFAAITLKANQIIAGTAINLLFAAIGIFTYKKMGADSVSLIPQNPASLNPDPNSYKYIFGLILGMGLLTILISWIWIRFTPSGLRLKAAGENPQALDSQGIGVIKTRYYGVIISGALAAMAGAMYIQTVQKFSGNVAGLGFIALAIMIAGQWNTWLIFVTAMVFGLLYSTGTSLTVYLPKYSAYQSVIQSVPFIISILVLVATSKKSRAPKAAGVPYNKEKR